MVYGSLQTYYASVLEGYFNNGIVTRYNANGFKTYEGQYLEWDRNGVGKELGLEDLIIYEGMF
jgi:hypothetical protein